MKKKYIAPSVEIVKVAIEKGFAVSLQRDRYGWYGLAGEDFGYNEEEYDL